MRNIHDCPGPNGKRSTSAATASGHELPDDTAAAPAAASLSVANGGDARVASAGCPESGKHCNWIDRECQTCGSTDGVSVTGEAQEGKSNG